MGKESGVVIVTVIRTVVVEVSVVVIEDVVVLVAEIISDHTMKK